MNNEFEKRRRLLTKLIGKNGIAVIPTSDTRVRSRDTDYPYRPGSDFYYFTGFSEPNAVMILAPGREDGAFVLCLRQKNPLTEYQKEAFNYYTMMLAEIRHRVVYFVFSSKIILQ